MLMVNSYKKGYVTLLYQFPRLILIIMYTASIAYQRYTDQINPNFFRDKRRDKRLAFRLKSRFLLLSLILPLILACTNRSYNYIE